LGLPLSVITCSHNPRPHYLTEVLDALRAQTLNRQDWEYLLVDNASDQPLDSRVDLGWHPNSRHVREDNLGLTLARLRAIREAAGQILVFVDDDNLLDSDYLEQVGQLAHAWPMLGAFGGQVRPRFEKTPPDWTRQYWSRLVIREFDHDLWSNAFDFHKTMPSGAGLCVRHRVADQYLTYHENGKRSLLMDRTGESLLSGGDTDLASTACDVGLGTGLFASLRLTHLIPAERVEEEYLVRLVEGMAFSGVVVSSFRSSERLRTRIPWKTRMANSLRSMFMDRRGRRFFRAVRRGEESAAEFLEQRSR